MGSSIVMIMRNSVLFALIGVVLFIPVVYLLIFQVYYMGEWFSARVKNPEAGTPLEFVLYSMGMYAYVAIVFGSLFFGLLNKVINDEWAISQSVKRAVISMIVGVFPFFIFLLFSASAVFHVVYRVGWSVEGSATGEDVGASFVFMLISFLLFSLFLLPIFLYQLHSMVFEMGGEYGEAEEYFEEY